MIESVNTLLKDVEAQQKYKEDMLKRKRNQEEALSARIKEWHERVLPIVDIQVQLN